MFQFKQAMGNPYNSKYLLEQTAGQGYSMYTCHHVFFKTCTQHYTFRPETIYTTSSSKVKVLALCPIGIGSPIVLTFSVE
jgi:hypothetical protein